MLNSRRVCIAMMSAISALLPAAIAVGIGLVG
ncbi:hypothetical protein LTSEMIS_1006, partial [Salmonella enterica subsp. enterica serovar Mississippi str. A4-633]